eukprot:8259180-Alexandrium_andersonii.AAC.1
MYRVFVALGGPALPYRRGIILQCSIPSSVPSPTVTTTTSLSNPLAETESAANAPLEKAAV